VAEAAESRRACGTAGLRRIVAGRCRV